MNARCKTDIPGAAASSAVSTVPLEDIVDDAPMQIAYYDPGLVCRFANASYANWFERDVDRIRGVHLREIVGDAVYAEVEPRLRRVLDGERVRYQRLQTKPDGQVRTVESVLVPHVAAGDKVIGLFGFLSDITERVEAEQIARRSQERLERSLEASGLALFEVEVASGRVYLSESWADMIGSAPGETHTSVTELMERVHPDERDALWQQAKDTIVGASDGYDAEHRVRRDDGGWIWVLSRSRVVERDAAGRILRMAGTNVDITARKHAEQRMHYLATRDALTDLTNRALFGDGVQAAIDAAAGRPGCVALIAIGLDRFTTLNDSLGHEVGDLVLKRVAERLTAAVARDCTVARPGGDEFLILIPRIGSGREAAATAEVVRDAICRPIDVDGRELVVTASIGIALHPDDGDTAGLLLRNANIALHNAKDACRPSVQFFANRMNEAVRSRFDTEAALRQGLERGEFVLHYQPQVVLPSGVLTGFEALLRWQHPERGLLLPEEFIPVAESTGLIVALGEWVIEAACREASRWQRAARHPVRVAVNVSAQQLRDKRFVEVVQRALLQSRLDPYLLEIEITENTIMGHGREAIAMLETVGRLGVQVAVDDFGTGYSSLSYLKRLPIDTVKIDQSFVAELAYDADANAIVSAIVALAHNLGLQVVAEGVESHAQSAILQRHGCDGAQGYMFGRPQPSERLTFGDYCGPGAVQLVLTE